MEEAIVDVALDLHLLSPESAPHQEHQQETRRDLRDQAQLLATVPPTGQGSSPHWHQESPTSSSSEWGKEPSSSWLQNRAARVEELRQRVANGSYQIESGKLAGRILKNSTRFTKTC